MVVAGVFVAFRCGWLSSFSAFLVMGMASLISVVIMLFQLNARLDPENGRPGIRQAWAKYCNMGRWALATCIVGWIPNYVYIPLVSGFSGMAAAGELLVLHEPSCSSRTDLRGTLYAFSAVCFQSTGVWRTHGRIQSHS